MSTQHRREEIEKLEKELEECREHRRRVTEAAREAIQEADGDHDCQNTTLAVVCQEFVDWGDRVTTWLWQIYEDLYAGDPGTVDPPPPPPFKGGNP